MELQVIQNKIYEVRGMRVMIDRDLAELYQVTTSALNQAVKRNSERFPIEFMFELTQTEVDSLRSQFVILKNKEGVATSQRGRHSKYLPYAFTEQGVAMLSAVLKSPIAIKVSINIMNAFVAMRQYITSGVSVTAELAEIRAKLQLLERGGEDTLEAVNDLSEDVYKEIGVIYDAIAALSLKPAPTPRRPMGYRFEPNEK